jgi:predicted helicase
LDKARRRLADDKNYGDYSQIMLYRPFDERIVYYSEIVVERMRYDVMKHMEKDNIGLIVNRTIKTSDIHHFFVTGKIADLHILETANASAYIFPLYLYNDLEPKKRSVVSTMMLFEPEKEYGTYKGKKANISQKVFAQLEKAYGKVPTPEQILGYCYAVLYSNKYREKYAEFLKIDFPRIPFTKSFELFKEMSALGEELIELHLLKHKALNRPAVKYVGSGKDDTITKLRYDEEGERVFINEKKMFENVPPELWNYQIGGYRVLEHYLKARKGRQMDDAGHFCRMAASLTKTMELQKEIDALFPKVEKKVIE